MIGVESSNELDRDDAAQVSMRGGTLRVASILVGMVASVVGIVCVTRALGPVRFGTFQTVVNLIATVAAVTEVGLGAVGIREYARANDTLVRVTLIRTLLGLRLVIAFAGVLVAVMISLAWGYDAWLVLGTLAAGVGLLGGVVQSSLMIPLYGELRFRLVSMLEITRPVLLSAVYALLAFAAIGEVGFLAATIPVQVVLIIVLVGSLRSARYLVPLVDGAAWRSLIRTNYALALAVAVGAIYLYAPQLVASFFASPLESGLFAAALRVYAIAYIVPATIVVSVFPVLARLAATEVARLRETVARLTEGMMVLGGALALGLFGGAQFAVRLVGGVEFEPAAKSLQVLSVTLIGSGLVAVWAYTLIALGRNASFALSNVIALSVTGVATAVLSARFGALGAASATVVGEAVLVAILGIVMARHRGFADVVIRVVVKVMGAWVLVGSVVLIIDLPSSLEMLLAPSAFILLLVGIRGLPKGIARVFPLPPRLARVLP